MFSDRRKKFFIQLGAILVVAVAIQALQGPALPPPTALAAAEELHGWAWSSNIGWVSFNCADTVAGCSGRDYKVQVDSVTGLLSGYVWSSNIGWIQFNPDASGAPEAPMVSARVDLVTGAFSGWARALSYNVANGDWDGWIKMSDSAGSYGVSVSGSQLSGFAWGGDVVGWLNFDAVMLGGGPLPSCPTFTASPNTIIVARGGSDETKLTWECVNIDPVGSCSIDQGIGSVPKKGTWDKTVSSTTVFALSCSGGGGATAFVEVQVFDPQLIEIRP